LVGFVRELFVDAEKKKASQKPGAGHLIKVKEEGDKSLQGGGVLKRVTPDLIGWVWFYY